MARVPFFKRPARCSKSEYLLAPTLSSVDPAHRVTPKWMMLSVALACPEKTSPATRASRSAGCCPCDVGTRGDRSFPFQKTPQPRSERRSALRSRGRYLHGGLAVAQCARSRAGLRCRLRPPGKRDGLLTKQVSYCATPASHITAAMAATEAVTIAAERMSGCLVTGVLALSRRRSIFRMSSSLSCFTGSLPHRHDSSR